jgi:hypothetical protein
MPLVAVRDKVNPRWCRRVQVNCIGVDAFFGPQGQQSFAPWVIAQTRQVGGAGASARCCQRGIACVPAKPLQVIGLAGVRLVELHHRLAQGDKVKAFHGFDYRMMIASLKAP